MKLLTDILSQETLEMFLLKIAFPVFALTMYVLHKDRFVVFLSQM